MTDAVDKPVLPPEAEALADWLALSDVQRRALAALCDEIDGASSLVEGGVVQLSDGFRRLATAAREQTERMDTVLEIAQSVSLDGETVPLDQLTHELEESLIEIVDQIVGLAKRSMDMVYALDDVINDLDAVEASIDGIERINGQTNLLALNATIEAHRAGEHGRAFTIVAGEVKALSNTTRSLSTEIREQVGRVADGVRRGHANLREVATMDLSSHILLKQRLDDLLAALVEQNATFRDVVQRAGDTSRGISDSISALTVGMQFQDRFAQRLQNVNAALRTVIEANAQLEERTRAAAPAVAPRRDQGELIDAALDRMHMDDVRRRFVASVAGAAPPGPAEGGGDDDVELF